MEKYEVQGTVMYSDNAVSKLRLFPPNAELIVWDGDSIIEITTVEEKLEELLDKPE